MYIIVLFICIIKMEAQVGFVSMQDKVNVQYSGGLYSKTSSIRFFPLTIGGVSYGFGYRQDGFGLSSGLMLSGAYFWSNDAYAVRNIASIGNMQGITTRHNYVDIDLSISKFLSTNLSLDFGVRTAYRFNKKDKLHTSFNEENNFTKVVFPNIRDIDIQPSLNLTFWLKRAPKVKNIDGVQYVFDKKDNKSKRGQSKKQIVYFDLNHLDFVGSNTIDTNVVYCTYNNTLGAKTLKFELYSQDNKVMKAFEMPLVAGMNYFKIPLTKGLKPKSDEIGFMKEMDGNKILDIAMLKDNFAQSITEKLNTDRLSQLTGFSDLTSKFRAQFVQNLQQHLSAGVGNYKNTLSNVVSGADLKSLIDLSSLSQMKESMIDIEQLKSEGLKHLAKYIAQEHLVKADFLAYAEFDAVLMQNGFDNTRLKSIIEDEKKLLQGNIMLKKAELNNFVGIYDKFRKERLQSPYIKSILLNQAEKGKDSCKIEQMKAYLIEINTSKEQCLQYYKLYENMNKHGFDIDKLKLFNRFASIKEKFEMNSTKYEQYIKYINFCNKNGINQSEIAKQSSNFDNKISRFNTTDKFSIDAATIQSIKTNTLFNSFTQNTQNAVRISQRLQSNGLQPGNYFIKYQDGIFPQKTLKVNYQ
jgi:hypothetical protein